MDDLVHAVRDAINRGQDPVDFVRRAADIWAEVLAEKADMDRGTFNALLSGAK